ncbi:MAG: hypothetical protein MK089_06805 [Phycisphaerales bacterium]|nr:hypothetical protein [Phycisphaerales bacterium]
MKIKSMVAITTLGMVAGLAQASPLQGLSADVVNVGDLGTTYRLYVNLDAGSRLDAVYGNSQHSLYLKPREGRSFYQNVAGGPTSKEINSAFFMFVPELEWDSYVSIGSLYQSGDPFGENNLNNIGIDWTSFENGGELLTDNGSWFVTPEDMQGQELNGRVFIAQLTIQGSTGDLYSDLDYMLNLQGKDADGQTWNALGLTWIPAPGAMAVLGMAALVGGRRRRA